MIKKFNKDGAVALYKREFAECLKKCCYEEAMDCLLKYSEAVENPDFHSAMGILYLLLTQISDDKELFSLAFREFMMHLITHPDSRVMYRNLIAVAILRRDARSIAEVSDFAEKCGQNAGELVDELCEYGLSVFNDDEYIDLDCMFTDADYGDIADGAHIGTGELEQTAADEQPPVQKSKVIKFKGNSGTRETASTSSTNKIIRLKKDDEPFEEIDLGNMLDMMLSVTRNEENDSNNDDLELDLPSDAAETGYDDLQAKLALNHAQSLCTNGDFDAALRELDTIGRETGRLFYCAECIRANIMMDKGMYEDAQLALDRAFAVIPNGALAGTIQCSLYVDLEKFDKIPEVLKAIDVTDYVDSDHVYRALRFAIEYCTPEDAMSLLEDYIDEFNSLDLRSVYAQMLYNAGDKDAAIKELRLLSRVQYDDFSAHYHYLMAKSGIERMPLNEEMPQNVLGVVVENIIALAHADVFSTEQEIINSEPFKYGLEVFLTLEFQNTRGVIKIMFETLRLFAAEKRLETAMRNALVSPYVEPLVKAVILGKLLHRYNGKTAFLIEQSFCPVSDVYVPSVGEGCDEGIYNAYALTLLCCRRGLPFLVEFVREYKDKLGAAEFDSRDIAYFLWRTVKAKCKFDNKDIDGRVHYALGYDTKTQAVAAYKSVAELLNI